MSGSGLFFSVLWATRRSCLLWMNSIFSASAPSPSHATYYLGSAYLLGSSTIWRRSIIATHVMRKRGTFCEVGAPCTWFIL